MADRRPRTQVPPPVSRGPVLTDGDRALAPAYFRLIDAADGGADWRDAARVVLGLDPENAASRRIYDRHLARARWLVGEGWRQLLVPRSADRRKA